jgi:hypothetical protein
MPIIKIKGDEKLFNAFHILASEIIMLSSIVQNDVEIEKAEVDEFMNESWEKVTKDLGALQISVLKHIVKCNE